MLVNAHHDEVRATQGSFCGRLRPRRSSLLDPRAGVSVGHAVLPGGLSEAPPGRGLSGAMILAIYAPVRVGRNAAIRAGGWLCGVVGGTWKLRTRDGGSNDALRGLRLSRSV